MQRIFAVFFLAMSIGVPDASVPPSMKEILVDTLFKSYNKNVRPGAFHTNTTTVNIGLSAMYLTDFDEEKSLFDLEAWLLLDWSDNRLTWNTSEYKGINVIRISTSFPWLPDLSVYNSPSRHIDTKANTDVLIYPSGIVMWIPPTNLISFCHLKMAGDYPADVQICNVSLGSWTHDSWSVNLVLKPEPLDFQDFRNENPRWYVLQDKSRMFRLVKTYDCCEEPYVTIVAQFALKRKTVAHFQIVRAPCVLALILTLLIFWIPPHSGQKIIVGAFLLLMLTALLVYLASSTKFLGAREIAVSFIRSSMYLVTSAIVLEVVLKSFFGCLKKCQPPKLLVKVLSSEMMKFILTSGHKSQKKNLSNYHMAENGQDENSEFEQETMEEFEQWDMAALLTEKIIFVIYAIVVICLIV